MSGPNYEGNDGLKGITIGGWAINLLIRVIIDGYKEGTDSIVDSDWVIPMDLKLDIEKFLEKADE